MRYLIYLRTPDIHEIPDILEIPNILVVLYVEAETPRFHLCFSVRYSVTDMVRSRDATHLKRNSGPEKKETLVQRKKKLWYREKRKSSVAQLSSACSPSLVLYGWSLKNKGLWLACL